MSTTEQRDWTTDIGILVVGLAAATLTFTTLRGLADTVGFREVVFGVLPTAWLLPVTIDAAGIVAARVWLRGSAPAVAVEYARKLTWACIASSIVGNAGQHVMAEFAIDPPWWVVVLVTAIPAATLGAVVHLGHLVRRQPGGDSQASTGAQSTQASTEIPETPEIPEVPESPERQPAGDAGDELVAKARELVAAGAGRPKLVKELAVTPHRARQLIAQVREEVSA